MPRCNARSWPTRKPEIWSRVREGGAQNPLGRAGRGKRGGVRVIYYAKIQEGVIWMLTIYAKNVIENIPAHVLRKIKEEIDG
jgi:hypothetical protein